MTSTPASQSPFRGPRAIAVAVVAVLAVVALGLGGAELYARNHAASLVAEAVQCEVQDGANVSFSSSPPVLLQYLGGHYTDIMVQTDGNQVRAAKGMEVRLDIRDIKVERTADSKGTIGQLNGSITWTTKGIQESIEGAVPMLGSVVAGEVTSNPGDGTIELKGVLDKATLKPQIVDNGLSLQIVNLSALGHSMDTASIQQSLDDLTSKATKNYPLGIHADGVEVTDSGVVATFSSSNATIPASSSQSGQDCFGNL